MNFFIVNPDSTDTVALQIKSTVEKCIINAGHTFKDEHSISLLDYEHDGVINYLDFNRIEEILGCKFDACIVCCSDVTNAKYHEATNKMTDYWNKKGKVACVYINCCDNIIVMNSKNKIDYETFVANYQNFLNNL